MTRRFKAATERCVKYTIRDGVVFDAQMLLKDVRDMVAHPPAPRSSSEAARK